EIAVETDRPRAGRLGRERDVHELAVRVAVTGARLDRLLARNALRLHERVGGERERERRIAVDEARRHLALVERVVDARLADVVARACGVAVVGEREVAFAAEVLREHEALERTMRGAARERRLPRVEGAVRRARRRERRLAGPPRDDVDDAT